MAERMIEANGVELCTEPFGDPTDPPILLVMGIGGSMLWWEEAFCRMLAEGRRFVIRYDHRDTGRSVTYEPGHPEYTGADLVADAAGVLDAYGVPAAHVVGVSAGGARVEDREVHAIFEPLSELKPPRPSDPPPIGEPGMLGRPPSLNRRPDGSYRDFSFTLLPVPEATCSPTLVRS